MKRLFCIAAAVAVLAVTGHTAPGKGGGKSSNAATLTFEDLEGDAIRSDGSGPYDVSIEEDGQVTTLAFGRKRGLLLDFSDCDHSANLGCEGPFSGTTAGEVGGVITLTLYGLHGEPNTAGEGSVVFEFTTRHGKWRLWAWVAIARFDDDGDGASDRFVLEDPGETSAGLQKFFSRRTPFSGADWRDHGRFFMPWGAELRLP